MGRATNKNPGYCGPYGKKDNHTENPNIIDSLT